MKDYSEPFNLLLRGTFRRRRAFLLSPSSNKYFFPPRGKFWSPTPKEEALCDAFILFFVSELEVYFEGVIGKCIASYENIFNSHVIRHCRASNDFVKNVTEKRASLSKNNNANWSKISHFFEFVGFKKEVHFPPDFWDDIEAIVKHRGDLAHNGIHLNISEDRRNIIHRIERTLKSLRSFDRQFELWTQSLDDELLRISQLRLEFTPNFKLPV